SPRGAPGPERMILGILSHPEAEHDAFLGMLGRPRDKEKKPDVRRLSVGVGRRPGLACELADVFGWKGEHALLPFLRLELPDVVAQRIHPRNDASPQRGRRPGRTDVERTLQKLDHRGGCCRMHHAW